MMLFGSVTGISIPTPTSLPSTTPLVEVQKIDQSQENDGKAMNVEAYVRNYFADTPIMADVARCESQFRQFGKNGEIIRGIVNPADVGVMQINEEYHLKRAKKLGLDLHTIEGNLDYARILYEEQGVKPWFSSAKCWTKGQVAMK